MQALIFTIDYTYGTIPFEQPRLYPKFAALAALAHADSVRRIKSSNLSPKALPMV